MVEVRDVEIEAQLRGKVGEEEEQRKGFRNIAIAMAISEQIGGLPSLTAAFVIATGICGAVIATPLLNLLRLRDYRARGFAAGLAAHGLGTARAFQMDEMAGTFAGIALALNGLATSLLVPALARLMR